MDQHVYEVVELKMMKWNFLGFLSHRNVFKLLLYNPIYDIRIHKTQPLCGNDELKYIGDDKFIERTWWKENPKE